MTINLPLTRLPLAISAFTSTVPTVQKVRRGKVPMLRSVVTAFGVVMVVACASTPPPTAALQAAEQAIATADRDRASENAAAELNEARSKLTSARAAVQAEKMELALYLADESRVNAELASARSDAAKAKVINDDMQKSIDAIKQEMQRSAGAQQ